MTFPIAESPEAATPAIDTLSTGRLLLRPPVAADAPALALLAGDERVARWTAAIPHPYPDGAAEAFIAEAALRRAADEALIYAICLRDAPHDLIGMVELRQTDGGAVELGYWLGQPWWGQGLMSEAVATAAAAGRSWRPGALIGAHTFPDNLASQRVLEKAGFVRRGTGTCHAPARACGDVENAPVFVYEPEAGA